MAVSHILTEGGDVINTEGGDRLVTEDSSASTPLVLTNYQFVKAKTSNPGIISVGERIR